MLAVPELTQDESKQIENELDKIINKAKGKILSFERWGKFKLTYPIRNNDYGVYFLVRFELPQMDSVLKDIQTLFKVKLNDLIMRHMVSRLDSEQSIEYQRPKSLEETPASRDMDSFLKENKMEGLLSMEAKEKKKAAEKKTETVVEKVEESAKPVEAQAQEVVVEEKASAEESQEAGK